MFHGADYSTSSHSVPAVLGTVHMARSGEALTEVQTLRAPLFRSSWSSTSPQGLALCHTFLLILMQMVHEVNSEKHELAPVAGADLITNALTKPLLVSLWS